MKVYKANCLGEANQLVLCTCHFNLRGFFVTRLANFYLVCTVILISGVPSSHQIFVMAFFFSLSHYTVLFAC